LVNIQTTTPRVRGFFMPSENPNCYEGENPLNTIVISSLLLKDNKQTYITIAHEYIHLLNKLNGEKGKNNYHSIAFKNGCEKVGLLVLKGKYGYNITEETPLFLEMLNDFKPNQDAFKVFQNNHDKKKGKSRQLKYICGCGCIIRTAKNENKPINALCLYCNTNFIQEGEKENPKGEGESEGENEN
jgi:hypothetical protein